MRWKRMTRQEWAEEKRASRFEWGRKFAWWPWYDYETRTVYWMEYVWVKWASRDGDERAPFVAEVRGGRDCPESKTEPVSTATRDYLRRSDYGICRGFNYKGGGP